MKKTIWKIIIIAKRKIIIGAIVFLVLALIWIELAVGVFGTPFAGS